MKWTPYRLPSMPTTKRTYKLSPRTVATRNYAKTQAASLYATIREIKRPADFNDEVLGRMRREADTWAGIVADTDGAQEGAEQLRFSV